MNRIIATRPKPKGAVEEPVTNKAKGQEKGQEKPKPQEGHRETVEALVVAFILALLVRGFEAEAFVIPTGSMAPTLMGRHKEIACPQCGFVYSVNASDEDDGARGVVARMRGDDARQWVVAGTCVNCRYQAPLKEEPTFNGDRILVMKFPYDMPFLPGASGPERWDVVVFRYPEDPEISYIKRLIGLPEEVIRIYFGDIYVKPPGESEFRIARKPLRHQQAMQIMVNDDRFRPKDLADLPEWDRWVPAAAKGWTIKSAGDPGQPRIYAVDAGPGEFAELQYRHMIPDAEQRRAINTGEPLSRAPRPMLITDFYSYDTNVEAVGKNPDEPLDPFSSSDSEITKQHWVGDLTLSATVSVKKPAGELRFELIEGGVSNRCDIDVKSGVATLFHGEEKLGQKVSKVNGTGQYTISFANVDDRLTLLVNDEPLFGDGLNYNEPSESHPAPTQADLAPARILASDTSVEVSDLVLKRDIYYTQDPGRSDYTTSWDEHPAPMTAYDMYDLLSDPARFPELGKLKSKDYPIGADRYMMLGDNSPRSKDGRGWSTHDRDWDPGDRQYWEVPRSLLTGKAFFVYWPHGKPLSWSVSLTRDIRFPFLPYFSRMKWIR